MKKKTWHWIWWRLPLLFDPIENMDSYVVNDQTMDSLNGRSLEITSTLHSLQCTVPLNNKIQILRDWKGIFKWPFFERGEYGTFKSCVCEWANQFLFFKTDYFSGFPLKMTLGFLLTVIMDLIVRIKHFYMIDKIKV